MHRYLVVANRTLGGGHLSAKLLQLASTGPASFHLVVPAEPPRDHAYTESEARATARRRLEAALRKLSDLGLEVEGEVGDEHPVDAVRDALDRDPPFDAIVLSTLKPGLSRWLKLDLINRIRGFGLPVHHVIGTEEPIPARG